MATIRLLDRATVTYESDLSINNGQVAPIGFGRVVERPWARDEMIGVGHLVTVTLAGDHRANDGHRGDRYLAAIATSSTTPGVEGVAGQRVWRTLHFAGAGAGAVALMPVGAASTAWQALPTVLVR